MLFSVIIPTYNRLNYLPATLESVWSQTFTEYEIIVVDDGSTDGTAEYLATIGQQISVITQRNQGPGNSRNAGAVSARGEYLAFLDSDDRWFPWALARYAEIIKTQCAPVMIAGHFLEFLQPRELLQHCDRELKIEVFPDYFAASKSGFHVGAGMGVYRADSFRSVGGFVKQNINCEDHDLALRLGEAGPFVQIRAPFTLACRKHSDNVTLDYQKTLSGISYLVGQEQSAAYPGRECRAEARREIIARHVRPVSLMCLKNDLFREAWQLYRLSFRWHISLRKWKYLVGFLFYWGISYMCYLGRRTIC